MNPEIYSVAWEAYCDKMDALKANRKIFFCRRSWDEIRSEREEFAEAFEFAVTAAVQHVVSGIAT